jgi:hypothetical protein
MSSVVASPAWSQPGLHVAGPVLLALVLGSCDPAFLVTGRVQSATGIAIQGAQTRVLCPYVLARGTSNERGQFWAHAIGWYPDDCIVEVVAKGFESFTARIGDHCRKRPWHVRHACLDVYVEVSLSPPTTGVQPPDRPRRP